jgi:hypothetical protein
MWGLYVRPLIQFSSNIVISSTNNINRFIKQKQPRNPQRTPNPSSSATTVTTAAPMQPQQPQRLDQVMQLPLHQQQILYLQQQ